MRSAFTRGLAVQAAGCAVFAAGGLWALFDDTTAGGSFTSAFDPRVGVDGLSGLFLGILGAVGAASLVYATRYLEASRKGRAIGALTALFVIVQVLVLTARDPLTFLVGWEAMTLVPAAVILIAHADEPARRAVFFYVALTHLAGAGTWVAILLLANEGAIGDPTVVETGSGVRPIDFATYASMLGSMFANVPMAPEIAHVATSFRAAARRSRPRANSA